MFGAKEPEIIPFSAGDIEAASTRRASVDPSRLRSQVESFPAPRSRIHYPDAMARTDELIGDAFGAAGWELSLQSFHREQATGYLDLGTFYQGSWGPTVYESLEGVNVLGTREGESSREAVMVLAHHDTVRDTAGADDNTASVVALIEVARLLGERRFDRSVILAAVDMEEIGTQGSDHLAMTIASERPVSGVIVLETLAYLSKQPGSQTLPSGLGIIYRRQVERMRENEMAGDFAAILYRRNSALVAATFASAMAAVGGRAIMLRDPADLVGLGPVLSRTVPYVREFARSDHKPFWERGLPAIMVTDTANFRYPHYHQPTDTSEKLDYHHLADITVAVASTVEQLAGVASNL